MVQIKSAPFYFLYFCDICDQKNRRKQNPAFFLNHCSLKPLTIPSYTIHTLGDAALLVDHGNQVDEAINEHIIHLFNLLRQHPPKGMVEAVPAFSSLAIFYDARKVDRQSTKEKTAFEIMRDEVELLLTSSFEIESSEQRLFNIPVCYDRKYGPDWEAVIQGLHMDAEEVVRLHASATYKVYMMGFLPGFPYLGMVDEKLFLPRKNNPVHVRAGSVGLAGRQTGIYPMDSPGGWHIIGCTPMKMFMKESDDPVLLRAGDRISFYAITADEFENY